MIDALSIHMNKLWLERSVSVVKKSLSSDCATHHADARSKLGIYTENKSVMRKRRLVGCYKKELHLDISNGSYIIVHYNNGRYTLIFYIQFCVICLEWFQTVDNGVQI